MNHSSTAGSFLGWGIVLITIVVSFLVSLLRGGEIPFVIGGTISLIVFPTIVFAFCGWFTKVILKRPMKRFGIFTSFFAPWILMVASVLVGALQRS
jgi:hypothetical protein